MMLAQTTQQVEIVNSICLTVVLVVGAIAAAWVFVKMK